MATTIRGTKSTNIPECCLAELGTYWTDQNANHSVIVSFSMMILLRVATIKEGINPIGHPESLLAEWSTNDVRSKVYSTSIGYNN